MRLYKKISTSFHRIHTYVYECVACSVRFGLEKIWRNYRFLLHMYIHGKGTENETMYFGVRVQNEIKMMIQALNI